MTSNLSEPNLSAESFVYKSVKGCDIALDVYLSRSTDTAALPIILWFHGGGLLQGTRKEHVPHLSQGAESGRYCLVAADYRLAPQVNIDDVIEDALDALAFIRKSLPSKLKSSTPIDIQNIAVSGSSAGGYIALLLALRDSTLRSCLAIYPITDPTEAFFTTPQKARSYKKNDLEPFLDPTSTVMSFTEDSSARNSMYFYMLDQANLAELLNLQKCQDGDSSKYLVAKEIEAGAKCCPIFIVHGNADDLVGVNQSYIVRDALVKCKKTHEFLEIEGADHSFDEDPSVTVSEMYTFMERHWSK